jgi:glycosyltransferase involved in cell wall biosynthesis
VVARQLEAVIGRPVHLLVSPYGIDHLQPVRRASRHNVLGRRPYVLYVGQGRPHKGIDALMAAYERCQQRNRFQVAFAGRDFGPGAAGALMVTERLGEDGVPLGPVDDATLWSLYTESVALVHLAEHEGFGFTPLEALAVGARVLVNDIPVLRETLGDHAVFTDPADPDAVARALDALVAAPDRSLDRARRRQWARRYRWRRHASDVLATYVEAAA